jgi:hypothetical protein
VLHALPNGIGYESSNNSELLFTKWNPESWTSCVWSLDKSLENQSEEVIQFLDENTSFPKQ